MNCIDLLGRVAVITGGAQGIGLATAQRMGARRAAVVLRDRDAALLAQAAAQLAAQGLVRTDTLELTDQASVAGKEGKPNASHHSASRAGLIG
jgi:3-oxoacyl-[acyl-carrier protein] reductase